jgi:hypothetical protein
MKKNSALWFFVACFTLLLFWPLPSVYSAEAKASSINRCIKYRAQVIRDARYLVGTDAPAGDFLGQIEVESRCDEGVTAFDGGMGLGQFMPETAEWIQKKEKALQNISMKPAPFDPGWSIRALILYDQWLYQHVSCRDWHYAFRSYNGGIGRMNKEIRKAGTCQFAQVEAACSRQIIKTKSGVLDMCKVNRDYPLKISQAGRKYKEMARI